MIRKEKGRHFVHQETVRLTDFEWIWW